MRSIRERRVVSQITAFRRRQLAEERVNSILAQAKPRFCAGAPNLRGSALAGKVKPRHFDKGVPCLLPEWRNLARCVSVDNIYNKEKRGGGSSFLRTGPAPQRRRRGGAKAGARKNAKPHISFEQKERVRKKGGKRAQNAAVFREKFCRAY